MSTKGTKGHATVAGIRTALQVAVVAGVYGLANWAGLDGVLRTEVLAFVVPLAVGLVSFSVNWLENSWPKLTKIISLGLAEQPARYTADQDLVDKVMDLLDKTG